MSTKTVTKRVALATVVALGAGVLSLVSVSTASAASTNGSTTVNATAAYGNLNIATVPSTTGAAVLEGVTPPASDGAGRSLGLLTWGDIGGTTSAGTTQTATILSTGALSLYTTTTLATNSVKFVVGAGGAISSAGSKTIVNGSLTAAAVEAASGTTSIGSIIVKPNSGATSFTVSMYTDSAADTAAALLGGTNTGTLTLKGYITVTVASASLAGIVSSAKSGVWYTGVTGSSVTLSKTLTSDSSTLTTPGTIAAGGDGYANVRILDGYGSAVNGPGLLQATATNGALIAFNGSAGSSTAPAVSSSSSSTAFVAITNGVSADDYTLDVEQPTSAPVSTTVTVTYNGTVIGTKSFTFAGQIAKITLSSAVNGKTSNSTGNTAVISFADAAGNTVYPTAAYFSADSASYGGIVSGTSLSTVPSSTAVGKITYTCGSVAGSTNLDVKYTNTDGTIITSNALKVTCSGSPISYTAAYDKSTYHPGDIATLVITFKDSKGNLANDVDTLTAWTAANTATVSTAGVTVLSGPTVTDASTNGVVKYTYSVGTTTGTFTNPVTFAYIDANAKAAGLTASGPVAVTLTIADGSTSLNDVLKGIVSLIASINKQIAALAKLVTKK